MDSEARSHIDPLVVRAGTMVEPHGVLDHRLAEHGERESMRLEEAFAPPEGHDKLRVAWSSGGRLRSLETSGAVRDHVVIGRHDRCDVHLPGDPEVSNRHAALFPRPDGSVEAVVLGSHPRLHGLDGWPRHRLVAKEPTTLLAGEHVLRIWPAFRPLHVVEDAPTRSLPVKLTVRDDGTLLTRAFELSGAQLGVLVGRARNSAGQDEVAIDVDTSVSRTHLLVRMEGSGIVAYDLCSAFGTWLGQSRVRSRAIDQRWVVLKLGDADDLQVEIHRPDLA